MNPDNTILNNKRKRSNKEKINEIENNFAILSEIFKTEKARNLFDSLGRFSFEEYSNFFQNLANKEYTSMSEHPKMNREPIIINKSSIKLNYTSEPTDLNLIIPPVKDVIKSNLEPKGIPKKIKEQLNKIEPKDNSNINMNTYMDLYLQSFSENISNLLKTRGELQPNQFKQMIKVYSRLIRVNDTLYGKQDVKILSLLEKFCDRSINSFFDLGSYWLYTEYLLSLEKGNENKCTRYDTLLKDISQFINNNPQLTNYPKEYSNFIANVPTYNRKFIESVITYHKTYLEKKFEEIKKTIAENNKIKIYDILPYLENMKIIYINLNLNKKLIDLREKDELKKNLLESFLGMTRNKNKGLTAKALQFIFKDIYNIQIKDTIQNETIKNYALDGLKEIKEISKNENNNNESNIDNNPNALTVDEKIEHRFQLFLNLCQKDIQNIYKLPELYGEVSQPIRDYMNKYINFVLKRIDHVIAEEIINECTEQSEDIVIGVIKVIYGNPKYHCETKIEDEKLYRKIKKYYVTYCPNLTKGVIEMANKIPINDFFTDYNFILNKIKQHMEENDEIKFHDKIFEQLNNKDLNKNNSANNIKETFTNYNDNILNLIYYYILYFVQNLKEKIDYQIYEDLMVKFHIKKLIQIKNENNENLNIEIENITKLIKDSNVTLGDIFKLYSNYKAGLKNIPELGEYDLDEIYQELDKKLISLIDNKAALDSKNIKFIEEYYKQLNEDDSKIFKEKILKNISSEVKGSLDLIDFGDL